MESISGGWIKIGRIGFRSRRSGSSGGRPTTRKVFRAGPKHRIGIGGIQPGEDRSAVEIEDPSAGFMIWLEPYPVAIDDDQWHKSQFIAISNAQ